jgi:predicted ATPase/class 3 adenylate cyclase
MVELPTGTVTFLFTDIEGSTKLLHELGDRYAEVFAEHRRIVRHAFAAHDGVEVDTQGDAFFVAFARATDAAAAAADAQRGLAEGQVRVRMGIHTGEPIRTDEGYAGMDVHRAARIAAVGHGGQVLISQTSRDLLDDHVELRDLGAHRLKDLTQAQRIYQLGDGEDFPPLKSLQRTNLPVTATALVGREQELTELCGLLGNGTRLVTVTGAGGSGKTRLALQVAAELSDDFGDGVFFVPLAPVQDAELVGATIEQAVGLRALSELREAEALLVLDNMEHLLASAGVVSVLLGDARNVKLLATSRAPLRVSGEHEYALDPLRPDEAVELFLERARSARRDVAYDEAVPEICRRLDGLPLALELAASRVKVLDLPLLLERLERRLPLLTGGARDAPERQQTLRATIEWSYGLLEEPLQEALRRLSVFAGSFSLEAAESVTEADLDKLAKLIDWSLVKPIGEGRFFMLETIREYALERLEQGGELEELRSRHLDYFIGLAERERDEVDRGTSASLERLESDHDNFRAALQSARELDDPTVELRLVSVLGRFWELRSHLREGLDRSRGALDRGAEASPEIASSVFWRAAMIAHKLGERETARQLAEQERQLAAEVGDERLMGEALNVLGVVAMSDGRYGEARELLEEGRSLRDRSGDERGVQVGLHNLGLLAMAEHDYELARADLGAALARAQKLDLEFGTANSLCDLGFAELGAGRLEQARARFESALAAALEMGWKENVAYCLVGLGAIDVAAGELDRAARFLGQVDRIAEEIHLSFEVYAEDVRTRVEQDLRSRLGQDRFDALRAEGRSQTIEEAVGEAPPP